MKVVVISQSGAGTNMFRSFLNSHPDVEVFEEIFEPSTRFDDYRNRESGVRDYIDDFEKAGDRFDRTKRDRITAGRQAKVFGFDLKYEQIRDNPDIINELISRGYYVIHLIRDIREAYRESLKTRLNPIKPWEEKKYVEFVEKTINLIESNFANDIPDSIYFRVVYENLTGGKIIDSLPDDFENDLLDYLKLSRRTLSLSDRHVNRDRVIGLRE